MATTSEDKTIFFFQVNHSFNQSINVPVYQSVNDDLNESVDQPVSCSIKNKNTNITDGLEKKTGPAREIKLE
jgi:hypothetical protein